METIATPITPATPAPTTTLVIEGQSFPIPSALATNGATQAEQDQSLRDALRPNFELAANATFTRTTDEQGNLTITVMKAPGKKGATPTRYQRIVGRMQQAENEASPALLMAWELHRLEAQGKVTVEILVQLRPRIAQALADGKRDQALIKRARKVLCAAPAAPSLSIPVGF